MPVLEPVITNVRVWGEMIKFSHSVFALPFAIFAMFLAARPARPSLGQFSLIVICMVGARSAAMTFNRVADAPIDAANPRTAGRALPAGKISKSAAWAFFAAACGLFAAGCAGFWWLDGNCWPIALCAPLLGALCAYSYMKHVTRWSHLFLGACIALAPIAAWVAVNPDSLRWHSWLLMLAVMFWIAGFDLIYACQDADFDRRTGLQSVPAKLGIAPALRLARIFHVLTVGLLIALGYTNGLRAYYFSGVFCVAALLAYENMIVSARDLSRVNVAFFTVNGVVGLVLGALGVLDVVVNSAG